uniref:Uncharacterized protein n=1 Tax=Bacteriophage sp. TaxID=38018 RepID=A0A8D9UHN0_9VIRU|nr:MAG TPA: hypothetical protein [Bacteriophage sp.]
MRIYLPFHRDFFSLFKGRFFPDFQGGDFLGSPPPPQKIKNQ